MPNAQTVNPAESLLTLIAHLHEAAQSGGSRKAKKGGAKGGPFPEGLPKGITGKIGIGGRLPSMLPGKGAIGAGVSERRRAGEARAESARQDDVIANYQRTDARNRAMADKKGSKKRELGSGNSNGGAPPTDGSASGPIGKPQPSSRQMQGFSGDLGGAGARMSGGTMQPRTEGEDALYRLAGIPPVVRAMTALRRLAQGFPQRGFDQLGVAIQQFTAQAQQAQAESQNANSPSTPKSNSGSDSASE